MLIPQTTWRHELLFFFSTTFCGNGRCTLCRGWTSAPSVAALTMLRLSDVYTHVVYAVGPAGVVAVVVPPVSREHAR